MVHVDYCFMNKKGDSDIHTLLSCADSMSGSEKLRLGHRTRCPRGEKVVHFLIFFGRAAKAVATASEHDTQEECTPKLSSPLLGAGDSMKRVLEGQISTVRSALEAVLPVPLAIDFAVTTWMVGHAASVLMRFLVRFDGVTAYKKVKKRAYNGDVAVFCEMVMLKEAGKHMEKAGRPTESKLRPLDDHSAGCR